MAADVGKLVVLMAQAGIGPELCPPDQLTNVTPPYAKYNSFEYWLQTEATDPPEAF
jgi:hypothetical protein